MHHFKECQETCKSGTSKCRQDSASVEAQLELQAETDRWRQESMQTAESLRESQVACDQAQEQVERLQGLLRDLQRHAQDRSSYDELQERFKEVRDQWFASHQSDFCFVHDALVNDSWKAWWRLGGPDHQLYCPPMLVIEIIQSCKPFWTLCMSFTVLSCIANVIVQTTHQPMNLASCAPTGIQVGHRLMAYPGSS